MRLFAVSAVLLCMACGEENDTHEKLCAQSYWYGTFFITYEEYAGGTCGPITPLVANITEAAPDGCAITGRAFSDGYCSLESSATCGFEDGRSATTIAAYDQFDEVGNVFNGAGTVTIRDPDDNVLCTSTYWITMERQ